MGQRQPTSKQAALGIMDTVKAEVGSEINCSPERTAIVYEKHRSSSTNGETTTQRDHAVHWATTLLLLELSLTWTREQSFTNKLPRPVRSGYSSARKMHYPMGTC